MCNSKSMSMNLKWFITGEFQMISCVIAKIRLGELWLFLHGILVLHDLGKFFNYSHGINNIISSVKLHHLVSTVLDFLKVRFCESPVGRKTDFSHLQRAKFYRPDFRSAVCPGVWQQLSPIRTRLII